MTLFHREVCFVIKETLLMQNQLNLYWTPVPEQTKAASLEQALHLLTPEELQTYNRYRVDFKKIEFLTGRVLLKKLLGEQLGLSPERVFFAKNDYGKLFLDPTHHGEAALFFNLTHTDHLIACVIAPWEGVGLDAERIDRDALEVMPTVFLPEEIAWVEGQPTGEEKMRAFFLLWTRKEAVMKAAGLGFSLPPLSFTVPTEFGRSTDDSYEHYTYELLPDALCSVALAKKGLGGDAPECRVHRLSLQELFDLG